MGQLHNSPNSLTLVVLIVILGSSLTPDSKCNTKRTFTLNQLGGQASDCIEAVVSILTHFACSAMN